MTKSKSKAQKEQRLQKRSYNELMYSAERNDELREECKRLGLVREEPVNPFDAWLYFATNHDVSWSMPIVHDAEEVKSSVEGLCPGEAVI